jgi:hypothetical protein
MPFGDFLDAFPTLLFVSVHATFLVIAIWAIRRLSRYGLAFAPALVYAATQLALLAVLGGVLTLKMGVVIEQTLVVLLVVWLTLRVTSLRGAAAR